MSDYKHTWHKCTLEKCGEKYNLDNCQLAVLAYCEVCNGAEASLPTDCPGRKLTSKELNSIQANIIDYKQGSWIVI